MIGGFGVTVTTSTRAVETFIAATLAAWAREIFSMMLFLFSPVPAAKAPAFCTKNTSSVGGYLRTAQYDISLRVS